MSLAAWQELKERTKQVTDLVQLVGQSVRLERRGRMFLGLCPWHSDGRPSLQVQPDRQTWKCWVCNVGGDCFSFIMKREGVDFGEAVALLAERAGLKPDPALMASAGGPSDADSGRESGLSRRDLYKVNAWAVEQYRNLYLRSDLARPAREYLSGRGFTDEMLERFAVGFAPRDWSTLSDRATAAGYAGDLLTTAGLSGRNRSGGLYDVFRGRVLFPIRDTQDRVLGFGGRILPGETDEKAPKYLNTPETPIFSKRRQLFGLDQARDSIVRARQALIVEGYTDVLACPSGRRSNRRRGAGHGARGPIISHCSNGFADRIVLVLDGDEAGRKRTGEVLTLFLTADVDMRVLTLPDGLDPADYLQSHSAADLAAAIEQAPDALDHKLTLVTAGLDVVRDTHRVHQALEETLELIAEIPGADRVGRGGSLDSRGLRIQTMLSRLARTFRLTDEAVRNRWRGVTEERRSRPKFPARGTELSPTNGIGSGANLSTAKGNSGVDSAAPGAGSDDDFAADSLSAQKKSEKPDFAAEITIDAAERELLQCLFAWPDLTDRAVNTVDSNTFTSRRGRAVFLVIERLFFEGEGISFDRLMMEIEDPALKNFLVELDQDRESIVSDFVGGEMTPTTKAALTLARPEDVLTTVLARLTRRGVAAEEAQTRATLATGNLGEADELAVLQDLLARRRNRTGRP